MSGKIILLIEDNPDDVELTLRAFKKNNIANDVVVAGDGAEALEYLTATGKYAGRAAADLPQVVLLDLKLPKVGGLEILRAMRADPRTRLLPVVVLTSSSEEPDIITSYQLGANSYIRKPVDFNQFLDAVRQLGLYWLVLNQAPPANHLPPPPPSDETCPAYRHHRRQPRRRSAGRPRSGACRLHRPSGACPDRSRAAERAGAGNLGPGAGRL